MKKIFKEKISRRDFLKRGMQFMVGLSLFDLLNFSSQDNKSQDSVTEFSKEAMFYTKIDESTVQCQVCFRGCVLKDGMRSFCRNKENQTGKLYSLVYARPSAVHIDPIEKEPSFHMLPGSPILCFGTAGCNFRCKFCHNWHLSQRPIEEMEYVHDIKPEDAVRIALNKNIPTLSFTYNEPTSFYEYVYDTARLAKQRGLKVLWHSNGAMNPQALRELLRYTDAVTIDLKGFTEDFYQNVSSAQLQPVLRTLKIIREENKWLEIVNLLIPTLNDNPKDIEKMSSWIRDNLGEETPLHFSRFFPNYKLTSLSATPILTLEQAYKIAKTCGLHYVTLGNLPGHKYNSTFCPSCKEVIILRRHFSVLSNNIKDSKCSYCGHNIPGIWS
jgi:pyruvate formate lyase activating enzyme